MVPKPHATIDNKKKPWPSRQSLHCVCSRRHPLKTRTSAGDLVQWRRIGVDSCIGICCWSSKAKDQKNRTHLKGKIDMKLSGSKELRSTQHTNWQTWYRVIDIPGLLEIIITHDGNLLNQLSKAPHEEDEGEQAVNVTERRVAGTALLGRP